MVEAETFRLYQNQTGRELVSDWPDVTVLIVTYNRPKEIRKTIRALSTLLRYEGQLRWHIADDGTPGDYLTELESDLQTEGIEFTSTVTSRQGWGVNVNTAWDAIEGDFVFLCEDDYVARQECNLTHGVALLLAEPAIGLVRYDGLAGHKLNLFLREVKKTEAGRLDYLVVSRDSPHLNIYSNRPHLVHRRFYEQIGRYVEGKSLGMTEVDYAHRVKDEERGLLVVTLDDGIRRAFKHVGRSRQRSEEDLNYSSEKEDAKEGAKEHAREVTAAD